MTESRFIGRQFLINMQIMTATINMVNNLKIVNILCYILNNGGKFSGCGAYVIIEYIKK